jgi:hypothetical protein
MSDQLIHLDDGSHIRWQDPVWDFKSMGWRTRELLEVNPLSSEVTPTLIARLDEVNLRDKIRLCYGRIPADSRHLIDAFSTAGFIYVESSYNISISKMQPFEPETVGRVIPLRMACAEDKEAIGNISARDFHHGRILEDVNVPEDLARKRNRHWIEDLYRYANIWVCEIRGEVVGFHAFQRKKNEAKMILTGLKSGCEPLAGLFWRSVMAQTTSEGISNATTTISANNIAIVNIYSWLGFRVDELLIGLHKHYSV